MSLKTTITSSAASAFNILKTGGITESVVFKKRGTTAYNPTTGSAGTTYTNYTIDAVFDNFTERKVNSTEDIRFGDVLAIFLNTTFEPAPLDQITRGSITYEVVAVETDPVKAVWNCQVRAK